ncbi:hypothetical protein D3C78_561550 [compost metagenome]
MQRLDHLRVTAATQNDLEMQAGTEGYHFEQVSDAAGKNPVRVKVGTRCHVVIDHQARYRVALDPAQLLYGEVYGFFTGDEAVADPALGQVAQLIVADSLDGDIDEPLQTCVIRAQRITVAAYRQVTETLKAQVAIERTIDAVVGAVEIVQINVGLTEGGCGNRLVMVGIHP